MTEIDRYSAIMARVPAVTWAMPEDRPDHYALAATNEYATDRLHKAAEIVWLAVDPYKELGDALPGLPTELWLTEEVEALRHMLNTWGERGEEEETPRGYWRKRALLIMNIPKIEASSSAARERTERFTA